MIKYFVYATAILDNGDKVWLSDIVNIDKIKQDEEELLTVIANKVIYRLRHENDNSSLNDFKIKAVNKL